MADHAMTTAEAAEALGVPLGTLKTWLDRLPIPVETDSRGRRRIPPEGLQAIAAVQSLRDGDAGYETIRRRLEPSPDSAAADPEGSQAEHQPEAGSSPAESAAPSAETQPSPGPALDEARLAQVVHDAVSFAVTNQTELAEKYARAAHQIGQLEERVANLTTQLHVDRDRHARELEAARAEIALLKAPAAPRPWWKLWG